MFQRLTQMYSTLHSDPYQRGTITQKLCSMRTKFKNNK
jgi:hypothetical protein